MAFFTRLSVIFKFISNIEFENNWQCVIKQIGLICVWLYFQFCRNSLYVFVTFLFLREVLESWRRRINLRDLWPLAMAIGTTSTRTELIMKGRLKSWSIYCCSKICRVLVMLSSIDNKLRSLNLGTNHLTTNYNNFIRCMKELNSLLRK